MGTITIHLNIHWPSTGFWLAPWVATRFVSSKTTLFFVSDLSAFPDRMSWPLDLEIQPLLLDELHIPSPPGSADPETSLEPYEMFIFATPSGELASPPRTGVVGVACCHGIN